MSGSRRFLLVASILLLVAFGALVALASGSHDGGSKTPAVIDMDEADEVVDQLNHAGGSGETRHAGDDAEDEAEGPDQPITGLDLERASAVALTFTGGGRVTGTEIEDEESYYEIEVTRDDGSQIDVQVDEAFNVVGTD